MTGPDSTRVPVPLTELVAALTRLARAPGWKQLFCGPGVFAALTEALPTASPPPPGGDFHDAGMIAKLLAVDIMLSNDHPPGGFRLLRHYDPAARQATCQVHGSTVSHTRCHVILEGTLQQLDRQPP